MKSICNLFKPIDKENGNFLLFSQYVEDISKSVVDSTYVVRPKRFICMDLKDRDFRNAIDLTKVGGESVFTDLDAMPGFFQNYFENGVSVIKSSGKTVSPATFSVAFWGKLAELTKDNDNIGLISNIKYVGDVDSEAWNDGFADIILSITSGTHDVTVEFQDEFIEDHTVTTYSEYCGYRDYENEEADGRYWISGWAEKDDECPLSPVVPMNGRIGGGLGTWFDERMSVFDQTFREMENAEAVPFTFNSILVLYNVYTAGGEIIYRDIPMGIYFTGSVSMEDDNYIITNPVTIIPSDVDAYGSGSGWSLRICTKFTPQPYGLLQVDEVEAEAGVISSSLSALMSACAETINTINKFADDSIFNSQTIKDYYSIFKNTRTNVPYIKEVDGVGYWFVNGRNTEMPVYPIEN